jgi:uncharacterized caspase-like protein
VHLPDYPNQFVDSYAMNRDALVVGINQYPFLKDTPTSKAKHLNTPASDAEAIATAAMELQLIIEIHKFTLF